MEKGNIYKEEKEREIREAIQIRESKRVENKKERNGRKKWR